jgi:alkylation response protein AidB-like acyl-CoA dehydrogenase
MSEDNTSSHDTPDQAAFRLKAREWMAGRLPPRVPDEPILDWSDPELVARDRVIQRALWDGGLAGITLPVAYGGLGLSERFEDIFHEEAEPYRLPWHFGNAFNVVVGDLLVHGSESLKLHYIPRILNGEHIWCQLLSEPSGGSDLAGLQTRATQVPGGWKLNGSKVWTTGGDGSDMGICLARTDPDVPKHSGLTMFVVDMKSPGMDVRRLTLIDGTIDFCQEFLDDVFVPDDHVVGEVNRGWTVVGTHLMNERSGIGKGWHIGLRRAATAEHLELSPRVIKLVKEQGLEKAPHARQLAGEAFVLDIVQTLLTRRAASAMRAGAPPVLAAVMSLAGARSAARRSAILSELAGPAGVAALPGEGDLDVGLWRVMTHAIGGGTAEMQANSVSERLLGLPREMTFDRDTPFNKLPQNVAR